MTTNRRQKSNIETLFDSKTKNSAEGEMLKLLNTKPAHDILPVTHFLQHAKDMQKTKLLGVQQLTSYQKFIKKILSDKSVYATAPPKTLRRRKVVVYILKKYHDSKVYVPRFPKQHHPLMKSKRPEMHKTIAQAITKYCPALVIQMYQTKVAPYPPSRFYPREYTRGMSTLAMVDPLFRCFDLGYMTEARVYMAYLTSNKQTSNELVMLDKPWVHNNFHLYLRRSMAKDDKATAKMYLSMLKSMALDPRSAIFSYGSWLLSGTTLLHVAILYGHIDLALDILEMGEDPSMPYVYVKPGRGKKVKDRRVVIPTLDLVRELDDAVPGKRQLVRHIALRDNKKIKRRRFRHTNRVAEWSSETYREIQNARRGPLPKPLLKKMSDFKDRFLGKGEYAMYGMATPNLLHDGAVKPPSAKTINQALAKQFKNHALRSPQLPREYAWNHAKQPRYLYRGLNPPLSTMLYKKGVLKDKGYIATSTDSDIAKLFTGEGKNSILLIFPIESIPPGTPWIWFDNDSQPQSNTSLSLTMESEVLLPPGTIRLVQKTGKATYVASYQPDEKATSLSGRQIMPRRDSKNRTLEMSLRGSF